jgi:hypothetical protein
MKGDVFLNQKSMYDILRKKGYDIENPIFKIIIDFSTYYINYDLSINYISGSAKEDIVSAEAPGMHLIIEPIILPSVANALFIGMYGDFEFYLNQLCKAYQEVMDLGLDLTDIYGTGINRAVTYLKKVVGLKRITDSNEWNQLNHWNRIRNVLVHNNGVLKTSNDMKSAHFLKLEINRKYNKVYLTFDDCDKFQEVVVNFIKLCI